MEIGIRAVVSGAAGGQKLFAEDFEKGGEDGHAG